MTRTAPALLAAVALACPVVAQEDEEFLDFSDQMTPICELLGLEVKPPPGWFNVPIEEDRDDFAGCQMMLTGEQEELVGMMRLMSLRFPADTPEETWFPAILDMEISWLAEMGITLEEMLFSRNDVPIAGDGFAPGKGVGLRASIEGNDIPQEVHFLGFGKPDEKYLLSLSTPGRDVEEGVYYQRNTADFGVLLRSFQPLTEE